MRAAGMISGCRALVPIHAGLRGLRGALRSVFWSIYLLPATHEKFGGIRGAKDGIAMNAGDGRMVDGLRRTMFSLVVAPGKGRMRAQRTSQCCHCASIPLLPKLQCTYGTPWEVVSGTNTLAPVRPMHNRY